MNIVLWYIFNPKYTDHIHANSILEETINKKLFQILIVLLVGITLIAPVRYHFANSTYGCYSYKHQEYMREMVGDETITDVDYSISDQAQEYEESIDLLIQELKETNAKE